MDNLKQALSSKSAVKDMKSTSKQMEKENMMMEKKLSDLREKLRGEMDARKKSGGPRWRSSQQSSERNKKNEFTSIKVLRDVPIENYKPQNDKKVERPRYKEQLMAFANRNQRNTTSAGVTAPVAANKHHSARPLTNQLISNNIKNFVPSPPSSGVKRKEEKVSNSLLHGAYNERESAQSFQEALNEWRNGDGSTTVSKVNTQNDLENSNSLLHGNYDEKESAQSFQEALKEWRNTGGVNTTAVKSSVEGEKHESVSVQSQPIDVKADITSKIKFNSSLSYMEKLLLKKHRENDQIFESRLNSSRTESSSQVSSQEPLDSKRIYPESQQSRTTQSVNSSRDCAQPITRDSLTENDVTERNWRSSYTGMGEYFNLGVNADAESHKNNNNNNNNNNNAIDAILNDNVERDDKECTFVSALRNGIWDPNSSFAT